MSGSPGEIRTLVRETRERGSLGRLAPEPKVEPVGEVEGEGMAGLKLRIEIDHGDRQREFMERLYKSDRLRRYMVSPCGLKSSNS